MQSHIYPTAPAGMQQPSEGGLAPPAHDRPFAAEGGEHVESPGKAKGQLSKVMQKARNLKDKLKKAAGHGHEDSNEQKLGQQDHAYPSHANQYGHDDVDGAGMDSYEDEEEEHGQSKYEQIHPIAPMDKNREGPDLHDASHEQPKSSQFQDMPYTSYNHVPSADISLEQHKPSPSDDVPYKPHDNGPTELSRSQHDLPDTRYAKEPEDMSQREYTSSQSPTASSLNVAYPDDIVKPNPEFGHSLSPMHKKIAVINEDLPAETRLDSGLAPVKDFGIQQELLDKSVPENAPINLEEGDRSVDMPASEEDWRGSKDNGSFGPLVTAIGGNEIRGSMKGKDDGMESYLNVSNEDARGQSPFNLNVAGGDATRQGPSDENVLHNIAGEQSTIGHNVEPASNVAGGDATRQGPSDENVLHNDAGEQATIGHNVEPASSEQDSWGKWPADNLSNAKDASMSTLIASDKRPSDEQPFVDTTSETEPVRPWSSDRMREAHDGVGDTVDMHNDQANAEGGSQRLDGDISRAADIQPKSSSAVNSAAATVGAIPNIKDADEGNMYRDRENINTSSNVNAPLNVNEDEEYFEPNNGNDSQFQEGFAQGTDEAEEKVLNGTLAGSKHQELNLTDNYTHPDTPTSAEDVPSPQAESESSESKGFLQGLRNTVASTFGYGGLSSPKPPHEQGHGDHQAIPLKAEQPNAAHSQQ